MAIPLIVIAQAERADVHRRQEPPPLALEGDRDVLAPTPRCSSTCATPTPSSRRPGHPRRAVDLCDGTPLATPCANDADCATTGAGGHLPEEPLHGTAVPFPAGPQTVCLTARHGAGYYNCDLDGPDVDASGSREHPGVPVGDLVHDRRHAGRLQRRRATVRHAQRRSPAPSPASPARQVRSRSTASCATDGTARTGSRKISSDLTERKGTRWIA